MPSADRGTAARRRPGRGGRRVHAAGAAQRRRRRRAARASSSCSRRGPEPADAYLPRALSAAWADEREIAFLLDVRGAGTRALVDAAGRSSVLRAAGHRVRPRRPGRRCWSAAGSARRSCPGWCALLPRRLASCSASAARRMPSARRWSIRDATVVLDPVLVTEPLARLLPFDGTVYACGPDRMLHAVAALCAEHDVRVPAGDGGGHGLRLRRLLRLRGADRRRAGSGCASRGRCWRPSGCWRGA